MNTIEVTEPKELDQSTTSNVDQVDGHLRAKELSVEFPDEQHLRVHKRMSLVRQLTLWVVLLVTLGTLGWDVFSIISAINLLVKSSANYTEICELTKRLLEKYQHGAAGAGEGAAAFIAH